MKGVTTGERIIVQANNTQYTAEQIADHEAYHGMADSENYGQVLNDRIVERIQNTFSREEFDEVLNKYIDALSGIYDLNGAQNGVEYEERANGIIEELLADAHAGMNMWDAGATKFTETVNRYLEENYITRNSEQDNGTEEPTGPPSDRYSYAGENANNADLDALARAKEMQVAGVADETIRQQTGWHIGMDGKWRWEIDDSGMRYHKAGDAMFSEMHPEYARHQDLMRRWLYGELTPEEEAEFRELDEIWGTEHQRLSDRVRRGGATLQNILSHDELFEAYPQLRKTKIRFADLPEGTRGQYAALRKYINSNGVQDGRFYVDFSNADGSRAGNYAYEGRIYADRVINDIKHYYATGETVQRVDLNQFRYSVDDEGSQQVQEQKPAAPKKKIRPVAESRPLIAKKDLRNTVLNLFSIPNGQRAELGIMIDS